MAHLNVHGVIKKLLRTTTDEKKKERDQNLSIICMAYNTSVYTGTDYIPFELIFRQKVNMSSAISLTPALSKEELFELWKNRHSVYLNHAKEITERNKLQTRPRRPNKRNKLRYKQNKRDQDRKIRTKSFHKRKRPGSYS